MLSIRRSTRAGSCKVHKIGKVFGRIRAEKRFKVKLWQLEKGEKCRYLYMGICILISNNVFDEVKIAIKHIKRMIDDLTNAVKVKRGQNLYNVFNRIKGILTAENHTQFLTERIVARLIGE